MILSSDQSGNSVCFIKKSGDLRCYKFKNPKRLSLIFSKKIILCLPLLLIIRISNFLSRNKKNFLFLTNFLILLLIYKYNEILLINTRKKKISILKSKIKIHSIAILNDNLFVGTNFLVYFFDLQSGELLRIISFIEIFLEKKIKKIQFSENGEILILLGKNILFYDLKSGVIIKIIKKPFFNFDLVGQLNKNILMLGNSSNFKLWQINKNFLKNINYLFYIPCNLFKKNYIVRKKNFYFILFINKWTLKIIYLNNFSSEFPKMSLTKSYFFKEKINSFDILKKNLSFIFFFYSKNKIFPFEIQITNKMIEMFKNKKKKFKFEKKNIQNHISKLYFLSKFFLRKTHYKKFYEKKINFMIKRQKKYWNTKIIVDDFFLLKLARKYKLGKFTFKHLNFLNSKNIFKLMPFIKRAWIKPFFNYILKQFFLEKNSKISVLLWIKEIIIHQFFFISQNKFLPKIFERIGSPQKKTQIHTVFFDSSFFLCKLIVQIRNFKKN